MDDREREQYAAFLSERRSELLERIARAASRSGRDASSVTLLAVSKTVDVEEVLLAHSAGYRVFGENRPQELKRKVAQLESFPEMGDARFDMIGNLQTNKVNQVLGNATLIHSVSSEHLLEAIARRTGMRGQVARCLLEVNVSGEASKSGFDPSEVLSACEFAQASGGVRLEGMMTMAPADDMDAARRTFSGLRELRDGLVGRTGLPLEILSCGMSGDFEIAIEEGSTLVRLGRVVFDPTFASA